MECAHQESFVVRDLLVTMSESTEERKVALLTGITGQDGSYLTELLLEKGYTVSFGGKFLDA